MLSYMCAHRRWVTPPRRPPSNSNSTRRVSQQKRWALTLPASSSHFPWTSFCTENKLTLCRTLARLSSVCFSRISERRCCTTGTAVSIQTFLCNSLCKHMQMHWRGKQKWFQHWLGALPSHCCVCVLLWRLRLSRVTCVFTFCFCFLPSFVIVCPPSLVPPVFDFLQF